MQTATPQVIGFTLFVGCLSMVTTMAVAQISPPVVGNCPSQASELSESHECQVRRGCGAQCGLRIDADLSQASEQTIEQFQAAQKVDLSTIIKVSGSEDRYGGSYHASLRGGDTIVCTISKTLVMILPGPNDDASDAAAQFAELDEPTISCERHMVRDGIKAVLILDPCYLEQLRKRVRRRGIRC